MKQHLLDLIEQFNKLTSDKERFEFLLEHKGIFKLNLDNDDTFTTISDGTLKSLEIKKYSIEEDELNDLITNDFIDYLGWSDGIFILLDVIGIKAEPASYIYPFSCLT